MRRLFLIDGVGALVSALMLGWVLPQLDHLIGMQAEVLYLLSFIAAAFCLHSLYRYFSRARASWLKWVAFANLAYSLLTLVLLFVYRDQLLQGDRLYFPAELIIIIALSVLELKHSSHSPHSSH